MESEIGDFKYTDLAVGGVFNRNNVVNYFDVYTDAILGNAKTESYSGAYQFKEEYKRYVEENGSVKGFKGDHFAYLFPIDIDGDSPDISGAIGETRRLCTFIEEWGIPIKDYYIFFSGAKGFHVMLPYKLFGYKPGPMLSKELKAIAINISDSSGVPIYNKVSSGSVGIDLSIYESNRLFRLPNTVNSKTGLYKVQIERDELYSLDAQGIMDLAKGMRAPMYTACPQEPNPYLRAWTLEARIKSKFGSLPELDPGVNIVPQEKFSGGAEPGLIKNAKMCISTLLKGVGSGSRDDTGLRLADHFRKQGFPRDIAMNTMLSWARRCDPPLGNDDISRIVTQAYDNEYDFGCYDHILQGVCDTRCFLYSKLVKGQKSETLAESGNIQTMKGLMGDYFDRLTTKGGVYFGIPSLDQYMRGLYGGHVVQYMAKSSGGKTSFAMHIMNNLSKKGIKSLFMSLEMPAADVAERGFQIAANKTVVALERMVLDMVDSGHKREYIIDRLLMEMGESFANVLTVDEDSASLEKIEQYIHQAKTIYGVDVIVIDYLGRMSQSSQSSYEHVSSLARELKTIAKRQDVIVFYLHQVNRGTEDNSVPITMSSGRDSGQTEEGADVVLGSHRPQINAGGKEFVIRILKNRRGKCPAEALLSWIPETMQFTDVDKNDYGLNL